MVNNVGKTTQTLSPNLGETTQFNSSDNISIIAGELGTGFLLFDSSGTLGAVSTFTNETDFIATTYAISIDVEAILNLNY